MADLWLAGARDPATGEPVSLLVRDGRVAGGKPRSGVRRLDAHGMWLAPGFIDLQLNGAFGHDFSTDPDAIWAVGERLATTGVTAFLPTMVSSEPAAYPAALARWADSPVRLLGARPLGWHFEGPLLAHPRAGAHGRAHLRVPGEVDVTDWTPSHGVRMVTLAPELPGALDTVAQLAGQGVVVAAGHTDADVACAWQAADAGIRYATHLLNAMRGFDARDPGIAAGLLLDARVTVGLITDGHHLHGATLAIVWRVAGSARVSLVSDGIAALGEGPGEHRLGGEAVTVTADGSARLGDGTLAGAVATLPEAMRNLRAASGCSMAEAISCVTEVPARLLGLPDRGHLAPGARGDAVLMDDGLRVVAALVGGEPVHAEEALGWG